VNLLQLTQALKRETGLSGAGPSSVVTATGDDARLFGWINWAWRDIQLMHESWLWRRGSALGQTTTPSMAHDIIAPGFGLSDFGGWKNESREYKPSAWRVSDGQQSEQALSYMTWDEYRARFIAGTHEAGAVRFWSTSPDGVLWLGPIPDSAHMVRADYIKDVIDLLADTDTPAMPSRFHNIIIWRALIEYGGYDAASEVYQRADRNYSLAMPALLRSQLPAIRIMARPLA
jgi:hypothetical protein